MDLEPVTVRPNTPVLGGSCGDHFRRRQGLGKLPQADVVGERAGAESGELTSRDVGAGAEGKADGSQKVLRLTDPPVDRFSGPDKAAFILSLCRGLERFYLAVNS